MNSFNKKTGSHGESLATSYLKSQGYSIHSKNYTSRWGEIDIIAEKQGTIHFVEVKTRKSTKQGKPVEAVTYQKLRKLMRAIEFYILSHHLSHKKFQIDVIGIQLDKDNKIFEMKHYPNVAADLFL